MTGILKIAYKLLVNDKGKFAALLIGITFAVFLMIQARWKMSAISGLRCTERCRWRRSPAMLVYPAKAFTRRFPASAVLAPTQLLGRKGVLRQHWNAHPGTSVLWRVGVQGVSTLRYYLSRSIS
jgi:hypothetical protein